MSGTAARMPTIEDLLLGPLYSEELGIDLSGGDDQLFRWFLASLLYGGRISETIARNTYRAFERYRLLTPTAILTAGWPFLVDPIMREGGYVRYDGRKSEQILRDCRNLRSDYDGSLSRLHMLAQDSADLERRLEAFHGVGPVTANIFLRELRPYWIKADPETLPELLGLAAQLGLDLAHFERKSMAFARIEAGLIRARRRLRRAEAAGPP
jgi:hypothetical protein